jgi:hypothetical protein
MIEGFDKPVAPPRSITTAPPGDLMNLVIAMPLRDRPEPETQYALDHHLDGYKVTIESTFGLPVIEAR